MISYDVMKVILWLQSKMTNVNVKVNYLLVLISKIHYCLFIYPLCKSNKKLYHYSLFIKIIRCYTKLTGSYSSFYNSDEKIFEYDRLYLMIYQITYMFLSSAWVLLVYI